MSSTVLVGRQWNNPNIEITVNDKEIGVSMSLADFLHALAHEIGNPTALVTKKSLEHAMIQAANQVIKGMKQETSRVM